MSINPNTTIFVSVLYACSHASLVKEGYQYFKFMNDYYYITPIMKYYTCMAHLLCYVEHLDELKYYK